MSKSLNIFHLYCMSMSKGMSKTADFSLFPPPLKHLNAFTDASFHSSILYCKEQSNKNHTNIHSCHQCNSYEDLLSHKPQNMLWERTRIIKRTFFFFFLACWLIIKIKQNATFGWESQDVIKHVEVEGIYFASKDWPTKHGKPLGRKETSFL